jgi:hypothetical protein
VGRPMTDAERRASIVRAIAEGRAAPMPAERDMAERSLAIDGLVEAMPIAPTLSLSEAQKELDAIVEDPRPPTTPYVHQLDTVAELQKALNDAAQGLPPVGSRAWDMLQAYQQAGDDLGVYGIHLQVKALVPSLRRALKAAKRKARTAGKRALAKLRRQRTKRDRARAIQNEYVRRHGSLPLPGVPHQHAHRPRLPG